MELKWNGGDEMLFFLYSSNRTFMELKLTTGYAVALKKTVLIAPLWN